MSWLRSCERTSAKSGALFSLTSTRSSEVTDQVPPNDGRIVSIGLPEGTRVLTRPLSGLATNLGSAWLLKRATAKRRRSSSATRFGQERRALHSVQRRGCQSHPLSAFHVESFHCGAGRRPTYSWADEMHE